MVWFYNCTSWKSSLYKCDEHQKLFGNCLEIHPFLKRRASLTINISAQLRSRTENTLSTSRQNLIVNIMAEDYTTGSTLSTSLQKDIVAKF